MILTDHMIVISDEPKLEYSGSSRATKVPSRAELGHFDFRAESELTKYRNFFFPSFSPSLYYQILLVYHDSNQFNDNLLGNKVFLS